MKICTIAQLKNVRFEDLTTGSSEYTRLDSFRTQESQLERHSLLFGLQDGKVEQVCAHQDDDIWIVNVKRGVVSMMQNSLEDLSSSSFIHEVGTTPHKFISKKYAIAINNINTFFE